MPIYLQVEPRLDDRAAKRAADDATKHFSDAGKTVGQQFSENLSRALSSSDDAFRKSGETAEKAYKRAADAAGAARVEEAKLEDLRTKGTGGTALLAQTEKLEKARRSEVSTTQSAVVALRALNDAQDASSASAGRLHKELSDLTTGALASGTFLRRQDITQIEGILGGLSTKAVAATAGIAGIAVGVGVAGKALYDLGATWDSVSDNITGRTGIMGTQLSSLVNTVKQVGAQSAISLEDIGQLAGGVAQSLHLSGDAATQMTQKLADIQQWTKQTVNTKDLGKSFRLFDITDVQTEIATLGQLTAASLSTNVPINNLISNLNTTGRASHEAGLNLQQTLGVLLTLEESGVSFESAGTSLTMAMRNWAKEGRDSNVALGETISKIKELIANGNEAGAKTLAAATFGKTGWLDFFTAIKDGTLDVKTLDEALKKLGDSAHVIDDGKKSTEDFAQAWVKLGHGIENWLKPVSDFLFSSVNQPLMLAQQNVQGLSDKFAGLGDEMAGIKVTADSLATSLGLPGMPGAPAAPAGPGLPTTRPGAPTTGLGPNFYKDWYKTPEELKKEQAEQAKLPTAPAVAYDTSLPPGYAGVPQTSEIVGAENSWMDARHTLAEKQARLDQLEKDNNAKEDDKVKARNDVINAQQGQNQAELRLNDARQSLYEKSTKQIKGYTDTMSQISAGLDKDLGISKGLPGLADNLVRFLGSLAAAPMLGQLNAISQAQGGINATGSGMLGILAGQGAFGPQYTAAGQAAAAAASGGGRSGGGGPSAVLNADGSVSMQQIGPGGGGRVPYGLPRGSNSGGYGGGGTQFPDWVNQLGAAFGVKPSTYPGHQESNRNEAGYAPNPNDENRGIDWSGPVENMQKFSDYLATIPQDLEQVIWRNPSTGQQDTIAGGRPVSGYYDEGTLQEHTNHVHTRQSESIPLPGGGGGAPGGPPGGGLNWDALAGKESSGNWNIDTGNGYSGGLQFDPSTWSQYGGTQYAPTAGQATKDQQIAIAQQAYAARGGGASLWPQNYGQLQQPPRPFASGGGVDTVPAMLAPGEHVLTREDVNALGGQAGVYKFRSALHMSIGGGVPLAPPPIPPPHPSSPSTAGSYTPGTNPLNALGGSKPAEHGTPTPPPPPPVAIQNLPPGAQPGAAIAPGPPPPMAGSAAGQGPSDPMIGGKDKPGIPGGGASSGAGLLQTATAVGAEAADMFAPGSGAAVQIASQEAQRAIKFAGQATGIIAGGLLDTFLPTGGSDLANNNWITRIGGAFAGVQPQIPNLAGKSASTDAMNKGPQAPPPMTLPPPLSTSTTAAPGPAMQTMPAPAPPQPQPPIPHFAAGGQVGQPVTVNYYNQGAPEDRAGADLTHHLSSMYEDVGRR